MNEIEEFERVNIPIWRHNVTRFAWENFRFDPDPFQRELFEVFPSQDHNKMRIAMQACAGPGKTAGMAICTLNFMYCYGDRDDHPQGAATATTGTNLEDNFWKELSKWLHRSQLMKRRFEINSKHLYAKEHPDTWFFSARTWDKSASSELQGQTLSGIHSAYVMGVVDESGDVPVNISRKFEQMLSRCKWGKIVQAGNPISTLGMLYHAVTDMAHLWHVIRVTGDPDDPNRSPRIDIEWAKEMISLYGRNDPWVMAHILGIFPESGFNQLIGPDEVRNAFNRNYKRSDIAHASKRIGVDAARFGMDPWVLFPRQGLVAFRPTILRGKLRTHEVAARLVKGKLKFQSEDEYVDNTGGYGSGVIDAMIASGYQPHEINFAGKATNPRYYNKRSEMWFEMVDWIKHKGQLPRDDELLRELVTPTYTFKDGRLILEDKEQIRKRLGFSPNKADALALTFAEPDRPTQLYEEELSRAERLQNKEEHYSPFNPDYM